MLRAAHRIYGHLGMKRNVYSGKGQWSLPLLTSHPAYQKVFHGLNALELLTCPDFINEETCHTVI